MTLNCPTPSTLHSIMTQDLALSLLRRGANGAQILEILESIAAPESDAPQPTLEEVQF